MTTGFTLRDWALGSAVLVSPVVALSLLSVWAKPETLGLALCVYLFGLIAYGRSKA